MKIDDCSKHSHPPITQSADNDASNERNLELLREEFTKTKPRNNMPNELMAPTIDIGKGYVHNSLLTEVVIVFICVQSPHYCVVMLPSVN